MKALGLALLATLVSALACAASSRTELRAIKLSTADGGVRVTLDTSAVTSHSLFLLDHPDRIVVDLKGTRLARGVRVPAASGLVETIRTGMRPSGALRVVIQLKSPAPARAQWMAGSRLVVAVGDVAPDDGARLASAGAPEGSSVSDSAFPRRQERVAARLPEDFSPSTSGGATTRASKPTAPRTPIITPPAVSVGTGAVGNQSPPPVRATHAPAESDRDVVIAVDAGHGGQDPGAIGRNGTQEKDVVLAIARALAARINAEPGMRAVMIRDRDYFVVLRDRMVRARHAKADLFVSVHADSIRDREIAGASVYVLSERGQSSEAGRWLAERENAADLMGGVKLDDKEHSLASVLLDLSQTANLSASMTAAERVLSALDRSVQVRKPRVQQAGLIVLKSPDIPSMLVETGYISNPREESQLRSD
ncbi:MAG: N-acetylmuramoyl-L-alanine amidase, partial [Gammaproteobacteria bacterium]